MSNEVILFLKGAVYISPAVALFGAAYYFSNKWFDVQQDKLKLQASEQQLTARSRPEAQKQLNKDLMAMQIDAVQRLVLFLERIAPNNMIMRLNNPGLPAGAFQAKLLDTVRQEFEHNLAQQIYISPEAWRITKNSKEEVLKIINMAATKMPPTGMANDLSRGIFEITAQLELQPTDGAIAFLKDELNKRVFIA
ncbi:MAG: hypothetical protein ACI857_002996 [Arenicella sp.]|jgi:hypothetical protein